MRVKGGCKAENLQRAINFVRQAATQEAQVVVLPEAMTLGWTHPSAATEADGVPDGQSCLQLRRVARENKVCLCSGLVEREGRRIFNSAVLIDPNGDVLLHHRKINELEIGHPYYALGDRLQVAHTPFGTFGLMICADGFAHGQVITRTLGYMGAEIILSPSAWAVPANHDNEREPYGAIWLENYVPVARDFRMWIAGVSNVGWLTAGPWEGRKCIGCTLVVNASGEPVLRGPYGVDAETILYVDVQLGDRPAQGTGWGKLWPENQTGTGTRVIKHH